MIRADAPAPFAVAEDLAMEDACLDFWADAAALDREMRQVAAGEAVLNLNLAPPSRS